MAAKANGVDTNSVQVWLTVDALDPQKEGDKWISKVAIHCGGVRHQNYGHCPLTILLDGRDIGVGDAETDDDGNYSYDVELPKPGSYLIGAAVKGTSIRAQERRKVAVEKTTAKIPHKLKVIPVGPPGQQKLFISVGDEDGRPVGSCAGHIVDGTTIVQFTTDATGSYVYQMNFAEARRLAEVHVGAEAHQAWTGVLLGS